MLLSSELRLARIDTSIIFTRLCTSKHVNAANVRTAYIAMAETTLQLIVPPAELPIPDNGYLFGSLKENLKHFETVKYLVQYSDAKSREYLIELDDLYERLEEYERLEFCVEDDESSWMHYTEPIDALKKEVQKLELEFYTHAPARVAQIEKIEEQVCALLLEPGEQVDGCLTLQLLHIVELCKREEFEVFSFDCQYARLDNPYLTSYHDCYLQSLDEAYFRGKTISEMCEEYADEKQTCGQHEPKSDPSRRKISTIMTLVHSLVEDYYKSVDELMLFLRSFAEEDISDLPRPAQHCFEQGLHDELRSLTLKHHKCAYFVRPHEDCLTSSLEFMERFFDVDRYTSRWLREASFRDRISGPPTVWFETAHATFSQTSFREFLAADHAAEVERYAMEAEKQDFVNEELEEAGEQKKNAIGKTSKIEEQENKAESLQQRIALRKAEVAHAITGLTKAWVLLRS